MNTELIAIGASVAFATNLIAVVVAIYKLGGAVTKFEMIGRQQAVEITGLKDAVKEISTLVTNTAVQTQRLDNISARLGRVEALIDDIRRGEGFILPLKGPNESP